ncbi:SDR family oxidoreductase [Ramlibacter sp. Leaf400]|uniref:SDR family oxidoreductase n=1 Tax=Ramlibacter sp. Leaf400 TaxID=1736365 RepID=UPI0006F934FB|nr:SDR family oxidoreductase [Ramlibacter sp. Leaf400]KQT09708.1 short-chain dehydrogenase [Ramlibacter sp. Leaf400]
MQIDLNGRTALVTGGSKGLGLATAMRLAGSGAAVAILARDASALAAAREQIVAQAPKSRVYTVQGDVTSAEQIRAAHRHVNEALGPVDILVNNAGHHSFGAFAQLTDEQWEADLQLKLMASVRLTRLVWTRMVERRWGRVINVLNTFSKAPIGGSAPTSVTRAAQLALTKVLSHEGAPHNVLVNALLVGQIRSEQVVSLHKELKSELPLEDFIRKVVRDSRVPMDRIGEPEEFANIACFLASDAASYITGTAINVDGGMTPVV